MAGIYFSFVLISWTASSLASVIPAQTENQPQEHMRTGYARPVMRAAPVMPVHHVPHTYQRFYNPYQRRPLTPAPPRPESERFSPSIGTGTVWPQAGTGTVSTGEKPSTGLSYINNLLSGVSKKTYGPARGTSDPVGGTQIPTSGQPGTNWGIPSGSGLKTPVLDAGTDLGTPTGTGFGTPAIDNTDPTSTGLGPVTGTGLDTLPPGVGLGGTGSNFGPSNPGSSLGTGLDPTDLNSDLVLNTGTGLGGTLNPGAGIGNDGTGFDTGTDFGSTGAGLGGTGSGGFPGGSGSPATDIFGPGLSPVALDLTDPSGDGSPGMTGNGSPGVIINNGPNQPSTSIFPDGSSSSRTSSSSTSSTSTITTTTTEGIQPQSQGGALDPQFPSQLMQSDTWVWPDDVITGALPSTQFGQGSQ